jgi:hypothetical protein
MGKSNERSETAELKLMRYFQKLIYWFANNPEATSFRQTGENGLSQRQQFPIKFGMLLLAYALT